MMRFTSSGPRAPLASPGRGGGIGSEELLYDLELALVVDLLDVAAEKGFVLCRRTPLLLLRRTVVGSIPSSDQHDAIDPGRVAIRAIR
jgi:hypothetical protein